jgi:hypothetical protein
MDTSYVSSDGIKKINAWKQGIMSEISGSHGGTSWDVVPCSLTEIDQCFRGAVHLHHQGSSGSKHLRDVGQYLPDYMVQHPRRQSS